VIDGAADRRGLRLAWGIALVVGLLYLFVTTRSTLWDRDEPRFARAAVEMVESGDYLVPTFNGELRPDKPVAIYWLISTAVRLLGPSEAAVRLWGPIGAALACFFTFLIGRLLFGVRAGLWAMVVMATTPMMFVDGTTVLTDGPLLACTTLATLAFVLAIVNGARLRYWALLALSLGAAQLLKGPVGLLPVATVVGSLWIGRRVVRPARRYVPGTVAAVLLSVSIFLTWFVPANRATGGELLRRAAGTHIVARTLGALEGHGPSEAVEFLLYLFYYPVVIALAFFPWSLYLAAALSALRSPRGFHPASSVILWSWILPAPLLMTLVATKIPHYVLSIWPALALAVGAALQASPSGEPETHDRWWSRLGIRARESHARFTAVSMALLMISFAAAIVPLADALKPVPPLARAIREHTAGWRPPVRVASFGFAEPTLNFYVGHTIRILEDPDAVRDWARRPERGVLVVTRSGLDELERDLGPLPLDRFASRHGFNFVKGREVELVAFER
jgi:4-amino-4-deoxy-L-arabinose transferase-like glycosyltransferase